MKTIVSNHQGTNRFLNEEGFSRPHNIQLQKALEGTDEGKELYGRVRGIGFHYQNQDIEEAILDFAAKHVDGCKPEHVQTFLKSATGNALISWFQGIVGDGGRALRTMHICVGRFLEYCKNEYPESAAIYCKESSDV